MQSNRIPTLFHTPVKPSRENQTTSIVRTATRRTVRFMTQAHIKPLKDLVEPGWANALAEVEPQVHHMGDFLRGEIAAGRRYLPASANILRAFTIPFDSIKVLIVGQDPYPTPGHPVGLSFCVAPEVKPIPRSLTNIYKELTDDLGIPMPANGDLTPWTSQGVMLLNRCLTVEAGKPGSHQDKDGRSSLTLRSGRSTTAAIPTAAPSLWSLFCGDARRKRWSRCSPMRSSSRRPTQAPCQHDMDSSDPSRSHAPIKRSSPQVKSL